MKKRLCSCWRISCIDFSKWMGLCDYLTVPWSILADDNLIDFKMLLVGYCKLLALHRSSKPTTPFSGFASSGCKVHQISDIKKPALGRPFTKN
jgi:hypothetical protein